MHYIQKSFEGGQSDNKISIYEMGYILNTLIYRTPCTGSMQTFK